jgi:hypothetical protein
LATGSLYAANLTAAKPVSPDSVRDAPPRSVKIPNSFKPFKANDVLKAIFADYDTHTGRTSQILNNEKNPSKVKLTTLKTQKSQGRTLLLSLVGIEPEESFFEKLSQDLSCETCGYHLGLAVLEKKAGKLKLLAYTPLPGIDNIPTHGQSNFDGVTFKLNKNETLIALRSVFSAVGAGNNIVRLFRLNSNSLSKVFERDTGETYLAEDGWHSHKLSLATLANKNSDNEIVVTGKSLVADYPLNDPNPTGHISNQQTIKEIWRFDGNEYKKITNPANPK